MTPADTASSTVGEPEGQKRLRRFVRHRHLKPAFVLQPRDQEIIKLVSQHRVISSPEIQLLVSGSDQTILRRLQRLFHHAYLDRPRSQRQFRNGRMVYALGQGGAELIAKETGRRPTDWSEKNRQMRVPYLEHSLMVSRFQSALEYACESSGNVALERWCPDGTIRDAVHVETEHGRERIPIAPDAFFILRVLDDHELGRVHCVLEADRGSMVLARFQTKLRGYFQYLALGPSRETSWHEELSCRHRHRQPGASDQPSRGVLDGFEARPADVSVRVRVGLLTDHGSSCIGFDMENTGGRRTALASGVAVAVENETTFERHYTADELAEMWSVSIDFVRKLFLNEPGVIVFFHQRPGRRVYRTLRIPESVALRVHRRMRKS